MTFDPSAVEDDFDGRIREGVRAWVKAATKFSDVTWDDDEPDEYVDLEAGGRITLTFMSSVDVGLDEMRREFDENTETQSVAQVGIRLVTIQIKAEVFLRGLSAQSVLERLRRRTQAARLSHARELKTRNMSINEMGTTTRLPGSYDTRVISCASTDFVFNVGSVVPDHDEAWIEQVNIDGTVE